MVMLRRYDSEMPYALLLFTLDVFYAGLRRFEPRCYDAD